MRPPSADPTAEQTARGARRRPGAPQHVADPADRRQRKPLPDTRRPVGGEEPIADPTEPTSRGLSEASGVTDSRQRPPARDYGPPHGHVIGHEIGGSSP